MQRISLSQVIGVLSLLATVLTFAATFLHQINPVYAVYALAISAGISAFTARVQGTPASAPGPNAAPTAQQGFLGLNANTIIDAAAATLLAALARDKRKVRSVCLRIYRAIKNAFSGDPDFE